VPFEKKRAVSLRGAILFVEGYSKINSQFIMWKTRWRHPCRRKSIADWGPESRLIEATPVGLVKVREKRAGEFPNGMRGVKRNVHSTSNGVMTMKGGCAKV